MALRDKFFRKETPPQSPDSDDSWAADCLLMLSLSRGGFCIRPSSCNPHVIAMNVSAPAIASSEARAFKKSQDSSPHVCNVCGAGFQSPQSLGGHKTTHRRPKSIVPAAGIVAVDTDGESHECSTCGEKFPSGQALGGHKRKHYEGIIGGGGGGRKRCKVYSKGSPGDKSGVTNEEDGRHGIICNEDIDLNMPAGNCGSTDEEDGDHHANICNQDIDLNMPYYKFL